MLDREQLAKEIFITDNGRLPRDAAEKEWAEAGFNQQNYAYKIADGLAPLIAAEVAACAQATVTAYVEAYPEFREGWGQDPESKGARDIARRTTKWLRARARIIR